MITNVIESREKRENALLEEFLKFYFVFLYILFVAIVLKMSFYIKMTWLY
jgi:hypothetical protein